MDTNYISHMRRVVPYVQINDNEFSAVSDYTQISPTKARRVLRQIKGRKYEDALKLLKFMPYPSCKLIRKILRSAASNAQNTRKVDEKNLFVKAAFVDQGSLLKRFCPRARGSAYPILKSTSHITVVLIEVRAEYT